MSFEMRARMKEGGFGELLRYFDTALYTAL
jgi:hypothetical protein